MISTSIRCESHTGRCWTGLFPVKQNDAGMGKHCAAAALLEEVPHVAGADFFARAYGTKDHSSRLKADYRRLTKLNEKIAAQAALSALLTEQDQILDRNAFSLERTTHIVDLIEAA